MNEVGILSDVQVEDNFDFVKVEERQSNPKKMGRRFGDEVFKKKLKPSHAFIGDNILFHRKSQMIKGIVVAYRENSVIVEISQADSKLLDISNNITVVNHKHYEII